MKKNRKQNSFINKIVSRENIIIFLIPFTFFLFLLLVFYPGIITFDGNNQWQQVIDNNISNSHPFFSTYFQLILSKIWNTPTVVLIFQILFFSISWSIICNYVRNEKNDYKKQVVYTIFISFIPIISLYSITLWKDVIYSYYLMILAFFFYRGSKEEYNFSYFSISVISLFCTLIFNYRHNGMIVSVLILITFLIIFLKKKIGYKKVLLLFICFIMLNGIIAIPKNYYLNKNNEEKRDEVKKIGTLDGFIIWMYGAQIRANNISSDDLELLNNIIDVDEWNKIYDPYLINSTTSADIDFNYFMDNKDEIYNLFIKYALKNPQTLALHYLKCDALLWSPISIGYVYSFDFTEWGPKYEFNNGERYNYHRDIPEMTHTKSFIEDIISFLNKKPFRVILYQPAIAMYIAIALLIGLVFTLKRKSIILVGLPMMYNILSLLLINPAQDLRYVYINYLTLLFTGLLVLLNYKKNKNLFRKLVIGICVVCSILTLYAVLFR